MTHLDRSDTRVAWWLSSPKRLSKAHRLTHPRAAYARCGVYVRGKREAPSDDAEVCSRCEKNARDRR